MGYQVLGISVHFGGSHPQHGVGSYPKISLANARAEVKLRAADVENGIDPIRAEQAKRRAKTKAEKPMAAAVASSAYIDAKVEVAEGGFKNPKHHQQRRNTIEIYANPIVGNVPVADVNTDLVLKVPQQETMARGMVGPLWNMKTETALRLRDRIEKVLSWAAFRGLRAKSDNPSGWKGHLETERIARKDVRQPKHHAALR